MAKEYIDQITFKINKKKEVVWKYIEQKYSSMKTNIKL